MAQISARAEAAVFGLLAERFNTLLSQVAPTYDVTPFVIDFDSVPKSQSFFRGQIDLDAIAETTPYTLPLMMLYSSQSANQHRMKPLTFSGVVRVGLDVVLTWLGASAYQDFNSPGDAVEDVMNTLANELANHDWPVSMGLDRTKVVRGERNWVQVLRFSFLFEVDV